VRLQVSRRFRNQPQSYTPKYLADQILMTEIHEYEGTINQFTGDGVKALLGAPIDHEDHAQRACKAALPWEFRGL